MILVRANTDLFESLDASSLGFFVPLAMQESYFTSLQKIALAF